MLRLLKDPLLHFVLIGAAIFAVFAVRGSADGDSARRIVVPAAEIEAISQALAMLSGQAPTEAEIHRLVEPRIREEILYREALALGLDRDDAQIRQRLVEKMSFLTDDLMPAEPPTEAALEAYFAAHRDAFADPRRVSFEQIYFSPSEFGGGAEAAATAALARLDSETAADVAIDGRYDSVTADGLAGEFGREFASALFDLPVDGAWRGPIRSIVGVHLVRITGETPASTPALDAVRGRVVDAYNEARRRAANEAAYASLRARYDVVVEIPDAVRADAQP